jgi:hypothetical protein
MYGFREILVCSSECRDTIMKCAMTSCSQNLTYYSRLSSQLNPHYRLITFAVKSASLSKLRINQFVVMLLLTVK